MAPPKRFRWPLPPELTDNILSDLIQPDLACRPADELWKEVAGEEKIALHHEILGELVVAIPDLASAAVRAAHKASRDVQKAAIRSKLRGQPYAPNHLNLQWWHSALEMVLQKVHARITVLRPEPPTSTPIWKDIPNDVGSPSTHTADPIGNMNPTLCGAIIPSSGLSCRNKPRKDSQHCHWHIH